MNSPTTPHPASLVEVRDAKASSVIVQHVPQGSGDAFMEWQRGVTTTVESFPGYQGTEVYPPADPKQEEWVVVVHFDSPAAQQAWLDSPARAEWVAKLPREIADFKVKPLPSGFGPWFAGGGEEAKAGIPPAWKMVMTVTLGLYPTVMLLNILLGPITSPLGMAASVLISNAIGSCLLQWVVVPLVEKPLRPWLRDKGDQGSTLGILCPIVIVGLLIALMFLFRLKTG